MALWVMVFIYLEIYLCRMPHFLICMNKKKTLSLHWDNVSKLRTNDLFKVFLEYIGGGKIAWGTGEGMPQMWKERAKGGSRLSKTNLPCSPLS